MFKDTLPELDTDDEVDAVVERSSGENVLRLQDQEENHFKFGDMTETESEGNYVSSRHNYFDQLRTCQKLTVIQTVTKKTTTIQSENRIFENFLRLNSI